MKFSLALSVLSAVNAFPHMAKLMQVDDANLEKRFAENLEAMKHLEKRAFPGTTGDHVYKAPGKGDFRGPCPGLNAAANHGYLPRNGVATFAQLVDAQMTVYNVGLDLAVLLCTVSVPLDGDIVTTKMSIGGDATPQTAAPGLAALGVKEGGLIVHNTFEADTSLTRNDVYLANGDNYNFNGTLYGMMKKTCAATSGGLYDRACMSLYRKQRYDESRATNGQFYFGIKSLLLFGASSFLYELMPNAGGAPDEATISSFFGAVQKADGTYADHLAGVGEKIPDNWVPRPATDPYDILKVGSEIFAQYAAYPVAFGGNAGVGNFNGLNLGNQVVNGKLNANTPQDYQCLLFQIATDNVPSGGGALLTAAQRVFALGKVAPFRTISGCPAVTGQPVLGA